MEGIILGGFESRGEGSHFVHSSYTCLCEGLGVCAGVCVHVLGSGHHFLHFDTFVIHYFRVQIRHNFLLTLCVCEVEGGREVLD